MGFCRARGVRVHVTVNTLVKDQELPAALELVEFLCSLPVDAVLVQDLGLFSLLRQRAPQLPPARLYPDEPSHSGGRQAAVEAGGVPGGACPGDDFGGN